VATSKGEKVKGRDMAEEGTGGRGRRGEGGGKGRRGEEKGGPP